MRVSLPIEEPGSARSALKPHRDETDEVGETRNGDHRRLSRTQGVLLTLALLVCWPPPAPAHGPAWHVPPSVEAAPTDPDGQALEHLYGVFARLSRECPTSLQETTLERAEEIWQLHHASPPREPAPEERRRVAAVARAHLERLEAEYPTVRIRWKGDGAELEAPREPIALARGVSRHILVDIENRTEEALSITVGIPAMPGTPGPPACIPPRRSLPFPVPVEAVDGTLRSLELEILVTGGSLPRTIIPVPVVVSEPALLVGTILEVTTGRPAPGRVSVESSDGVLRHGEDFASNPTLSEKPVIFRPAWRKLPFFYSDGRFQLFVPPGRTRVTLERGFEHSPASEELDLEPGERREITLSSSRFADMKALGWISGDTHVHWVTNAWDTNEDLSLLSMVQRAEDLRVINNLTLYQWRPDAQGGPFIKPDHAPMGPLAGMCDGEYHVQMAEEYRNDNHWGHINLLGIRSLIQPIATGAGSGGPPGAPDFPLNREAILEARRQGGIICEAHNLGPFNASAVPVDVALGLADSLDQLEPDPYYRFLDCGFRIGLSNGSDHPARVAGCARVYVRVEGPFTYAAWLEGLRKGRTFTTSGPLLILTVNGSGPGEVLSAARGERLRVQVQALSRHPLGEVQVISNGEIVRSVRTEETRAELTLELEATGSRWVVARCSRNGNHDAISGPDIAHTSAVWAEVDGKRVIRKEAAESWIRNIRIHEERCRLQGVFADDAQRREALAFIAEGIRKYEELIR